MNKKVKKVMVFGVFDRLHPGHLDFLRQAAEYGDELIVVVARDAAVLELKKKTPFHSEAERLAMVQNIPKVTLGVLGDEVQGSYGVIAVHQPDVICIGYDQHELREDLSEQIRTEAVIPVNICTLEPHNPNHYHTSLLDTTLDRKARKKIK